MLAVTGCWAVKLIKIHKIIDYIFWQCIGLGWRVT